MLSCKRVRALVCGLGRFGFVLGRFFPLLWDEEGEKTVELNCYFKYLIEMPAFETMCANLQNPCRNFPTYCV